MNENQMRNYNQILYFYISYRLSVAYISQTLNLLVLGLKETNRTKKSDMAFWVTAKFGHITIVLLIGREKF